MDRVVVVAQVARDLDLAESVNALLEPLVDAIRRHVLSAEAFFADDTPVAMLVPTISPKPCRLGLSKCLGPASPRACHRRRVSAPTFCLSL